MRIASLGCFVFAASAFALSTTAAVTGQGQPLDVTFQVAKAPADVYDAVLRTYQLKKSEPKDTFEIDAPTSSKDLGKLTVWEIVDTGGLRNNNTGYKINVDVIKDSATSSTVRVNVDVQQRTKHRIAEKWGKSKPSPEKAASVAAELKTALGA
jgi:hypothetical protein